MQAVFGIVIANNRQFSEYYKINLIQRFIDLSDCNKTVFIPLIF